MLFKQAIYNVIALYTFIHLLCKKLYKVLGSYLTTGTHLISLPTKIHKIYARYFSFIQHAISQLSLLYYAPNDFWFQVLIDIKIIYIYKITFNNTLSTHEGNHDPKNVENNISYALETYMAVFWISGSLQWEPHCAVTNSVYRITWHLA